MANEPAANRLIEETLDATEDDPRVLVAVKEYLALLEAGDAPGRQAFLARHADIAEALGEFLDGLEMVHGAAQAKLQRVGSQLSADLASGQPTTLGDYRILREVDRGGMGVVYEALHLPLSRRVALKVLPAISALDGLRLQRFKIEAQAAARLQHPNIVQVFSVGSEQDVNYFAMQLIDGQPLSAVVTQLRQDIGKQDSNGDDCSSPFGQTDQHAPKRRPQMRTRGGAEDSTDRKQSGPTKTSATADNRDISDWPLVKSYAHRADYFRNVARLIQQAAAALEHAHQCGVIHRDMKPGNLLVDERGHLWVADFGLARIASDAHLTQTGNPLGTFRYMSPEQAGGERTLVDHRTDIYSLGITFYELLTLEPAITGSESHTLLRKVVEEEPRPPRFHDSAIPADLETIVLKAASKSPADRYASAQLLSEDLQRWLNDEPILARPPGIWECAAKWRRRHKILVQTAAIFAAVAITGLVCGTILVARAYHQEAIQRQAAEANFDQARRAVEAFSQLGETELAAKPELRDVRRRLLDISLAYYREFIASQHADASAVESLAAASQRIERIVNELRVLEGTAPLLMLSDARVQKDLKLSDDQRNKIEALLADLERDRFASSTSPDGNEENAQQQLVQLLEKNEQLISSVLDGSQRDRLRQIAWQQRAPFIFRSPEVIEALDLTPEQRLQVSTIIEEERIGGHGKRQFAQSEGPPPDMRHERFGPRGPHNARQNDSLDQSMGEYEDWLREQEDRMPPPDDSHGPPGHHDEFGDHGPPPEPEPGFEHGGPPDGGPPGDRGHHEDGPGGMADSKARATARILAILSPAQKSTWQQLTGLPVNFDLHWGPDDVLPR